MIDTWKANPPTWKCFLQTIGQKCAKDYRFIEKPLCSKLQNIEFNVQVDASNPNLMAQVNVTKDALSKHQQTKIQGAKILSRAK